ncbi:MAG TPA: hypothetical protein VN751_03415 [Solirubrobacteraceae bacterium]|nr:hypothetical protein [Solirubrobacteraceae bacterium]
MKTTVRRLLPVVAIVAALLAVAPVSPASAHGGRQAQRQSVTSLRLDPRAAAALQSLGVTAAPIAPAFANDRGLNFPISGSLLNALFTRTIRHSGGIALTAGTTRVELTRFYVNVDRAPDLTTLVGGQRVSILDLDLSTASIRFRRGKFTVGPVAARLTQAAAAALNGAFGVTAFSKGLLLGQATVRARLF